MLYSMKECDFILERIEKENPSLTDWEENFLRSVKAARSIGAGLTNKQVECLSRIWDKIGG